MSRKEEKCIKEPFIDTWDGAIGGDDEDDEDDDYDPGKEEGVDVSEEEASGDDEDAGCDSSTGKRKKKSVDSPNKELKTESKLTPEEEAAREDELWALLNGPSEPATSSTKSAEVKTTPESRTVKSEEIPSSSSIVSSTDSESVATTPATKTQPPVVRKSGGLSSLAASLGKKKGPSTLLKSKADWDTYKNEQGLTEELAEHTKGKDSFVERQAFLQRSDLRQFEQEKSVRDKIRARRLP